MELLRANIQWLMLAGGLTTSTMLMAIVAPRWLFTTMFNDTAGGPLGDLLSRNWGVLIGITSALLLWGAFHPADRPIALVVACVSKLAFIVLVLRVPAYRAKALVPLIIDTTLVVLYGSYLLAPRVA